MQAGRWSQSLNSLFLCHRTQPLWGPHRNLLWLELMLPECHISACCSQKCCQRLSSRGTCPPAPRARPPLPPSAVSGVPQGKGKFSDSQPRELGSSPRPLWGSAGKIAAGHFEFRNMELFRLAMSIGQIHFSFALPSGIEMDVQFRVYIEATIWFREDWGSNEKYILFLFKIFYSSKYKEIMFREKVVH